MRRLSLLAGFVLIVSLAFGSGAEANDDDPLLVDKDRAQCPSAEYTSIQAAVAAADPGDTILVCPDTYNEVVTIAGPAKNGLRLRAKGRREQVVLDGLDTLENGFRLRNVSGVLIRGFTVQRYHDDIWLETDANENTIRGNDLRFAFGHDGVVVQGHRNTVIGNIAHDNRAAISCGISLGTGASNNLVRDNESYMNPNVGILLGGALLGPAGPGNRILDNFVHDIGQPFPGTSGGNGILNNAPQTVIEDNDVRNSAANGILLTGAVTTGTVVEDNEVARNGQDGVRVANATQNWVIDNELERNALNGIGLVNGDNNTISGNESEENGVDGIRADSASAGNTIRRNEMEGNAEHDCHDDSVGAGTAGTANFWIDNEGETENRPGLCEPDEGDDD